MMPSPTPAPIHDIAGPLSLPGIPLPAAIAGATLLLALALLGIWFARGRLLAHQPTPKERAQKALEALRSSEATSYEFGVRASDILRTYIRDQHGVDATTRTSLEFLQELRNNPVFNDNEKASLAAFLESSDLLKYARAEAAQDEISQLFETASRLVAATGEQGK